MEDPVVAQVKQTHDFATQSALPTLEVSGPAVAEQHRILTPAALAFVADLVQRFHPQVQAMLEARKTQQAQYDAGTLPQFPTQTPEIADSEWRVAPIPQDLLNRRVEITGPVDRKMIINALNSRANVFMADFEDSTAPSWSAIVSGQVNLYDAVRRTIAYTHPVTAKHYSLGTKTATLMVRPRGWHLSEAHLTRNHVPVPASLVDFGLFFFHNARELIARGSGPYFYLPKLQGAAEAALWNEVFVH